MQQLCVSSDSSESWVISVNEEFLWHDLSHNWQLTHLISHFSRWARVFYCLDRTVKTFMILQKILVFIKCFYFEPSVHQIILKENVSVSTKILSSATVFNIDNNNQMFLEDHISIFEYFLKDHVTPGVMAAENSALPAHEYIIF